jgi:hypothetical protein
MSNDAIRALKAALEVKTDVELAKALGIERSTVAQWKRRGGPPEKYMMMIGEDPKRFARAWDAVRHHLLGRVENHYFLRAGLAFLPKDLPTPPNASKAELGQIREQMLLALMNLAQITTYNRLEKRYCENEEDYAFLVQAMEIAERELIALIVAGDGGAVPQSGSSTHDH